MLLPAANPDQIAAVETVLTAPDLVLVQGPPGTGKTTVIAEICYQIALRGGRTLIASQANLAVDNALSRLVHNPIIRALRKGRAERVEEEGLPFVEDRVVDTWLRNTAADCEEGLSKRLENVQVFRQLLTSSAQFAVYLEAEETFERNRKLLQSRRESLQPVCTAQEIAYKEAEAQRCKCQSLHVDLEAMLAFAPKVNWEEREVIDLLARLKLYLDADDSFNNFAKEIDVAVSLVARFGLVPPNRELFGIAAWLQEAVLPWIKAVHMTFTQAYSLAKMMAETEEAAQLFAQASNSLVQLQEKNQKLLEEQSKYQQSIEDLIERRSQLRAIVSELEEWSSTAYVKLYERLSIAFRNNRHVTEDLVQLPSRLNELSQQLGIYSRPWLPSIMKCRFQLNSFIHQVNEWEEVLRIANNISSAILQAPNEVTNKLNSKPIDWDEGVDIDGFSSISALKELEQVTQDIIKRVNNEPGFWGFAAELIFNNDRFDAAATRLKAITYQCQTIIDKARPDKPEIILKQLAVATVKDISATNAWLDQLQNETEVKIQQSQAKTNELWTIKTQTKMQMSITQLQIQEARSEANSKFNQSISIAQELVQSPHLNKTLYTLIEQLLRTSWEQLNLATEFSKQLHLCEDQINQIAVLIPSLDPFSRLLKIKDHISDRLSNLQKASESSLVLLTDSQRQLHEIETQLQQMLSALMVERNWWQAAWQVIPTHFKPVVSSTGLFELDFLRNVKAQFDAWQKELAQEEAYLNRYQNFAQNWIARLRDISQQDCDELRRIYLDNANVIAITCIQAANCSFSEEFKNFDVVIIDEVSKCTPLDLLIPALKGKKLVLIGDYRQLPPMFSKETLEDVAKESRMTREELGFVEESLFKRQFEAANEQIKQRLNIQYRMHPSIMGAINQFYDERLICGLLEPDKERSHHLANEIIKEQLHILWVKMPAQSGFEEQTEGTSFINIREIDVIERLCQQMEAAYFSKHALGEPRKEIGIITFYGIQLRLIEDRLDPKLFPSLHTRTGTVDRFQGMERQVVIVSMVRNNREGKVGFAKKPERVNVAFSRAQELLVIVGCHSLFTQHARGVGSMYSKVSDTVRQHGGLIDVSAIL